MNLFGIRVVEAAEDRSNMLRNYKPERILAAAALLSWATILPAQEKKAVGTIRVETSTVVVDLVVTRHGRHVAGLTPADFTIYEDGIPQKIVSFPPANDSPASPRPGRLAVERMTLKCGNEVVKAAVAENIQSLPGPDPNSVLVLAEYNLEGLPAGRYTVWAATRDLVRNTSLSEQSEFEVQ